MENATVSKFMIAKKIPAQFKRSDSIQELWREHKKRIDQYYKVEEEIDVGKKSFKEMRIPVKTLLDLKIEIASRIIQNCHFCIRKCMVNRRIGQTGYCKCGNKIAISSIFQHLGEEPELVPSGTIFSMGCTMRCHHCQNWPIANWLEEGVYYTPKELAERVRLLRLSGCKNANLVGGEPTPWLLHWLQTFKHVSINIPVIWNSNAYYSPETARLLTGFVDVYLLDFKYGRDKCAKRISDAPDYWGTVTTNHLEADKKGELIVRVLILPNHIECCAEPIIKWVAKNLGLKTRVNIMFQFRPEWRAHELSELNRRLSEEEIRNVMKLAEKVGLENYIN